MKRLPEWKRQSIVRALVMGDLTYPQIAVECGASLRTIERIAKTLDTGGSVCAYAVNG